VFASFRTIVVYSDTLMRSVQNTGIHICHQT